MFRDAEQHLDRCIQLREQLAERDQRRQRMLPFLALSYLDMVGAQVGSERLYEANQTASLLRNVLSESDPSGGGRSTRAILGRDLAFWSCRREAYWVPSESKLILAVPTDPSPSNDESP
jgi:hypothetical protein